MPCTTAAVVGRRRGVSDIYVGDAEGKGHTTLGEYLLT